MHEGQMNGRGSKSAYGYTMVYWSDLNRNNNNSPTYDCLIVQDIKKEQRYVYCFTFSGVKKCIQYIYIIIIFNYCY